PGDRHGRLRARGRPSHARHQGGSTPHGGATMNRSDARPFPRLLGVWRPAALASAVFVLASASTAQAGINVWTTPGPETRDHAVPVFALAIDPTTPTTLYAGTLVDVVVGVANGRQLFKSTDAAGTWSAASTGVPTNLLFVGALAIDPSTPSTLYAVAAGL